MGAARRKTSELLDEDPDLEEVLERIVAIDDEEGEVTWSDIKDVASSGQWGRLLEKDVLVEAADGDGFELADPDGVREILGIGGGGGEGGVDVDVDVEQEDLDTSWTVYDKAAALVGLFLIVFGYRDAAIQSVIGGAINVVVLPLHDAAGMPFYLIVLALATFTGLYSSYLQRYMMDWDWINAQQEKVKAIQSELKEAQMGDDDDRQEALQEEQKEVMAEQMKMFKMQFRPSVWIMVITIPIFIWMFWTFGGRANIESHLPGGTMPTMHMPFVGAVPFDQQVIGFLPFGQAWFVWYILCSFGFGQVMRKVLGVNPTT
jgi:uncharacterized membrane protein (DUF106 family)